MIIDNESYFSKSQAITVEAVSTVKLDMVKAGLPVIPGMFLTVLVGPVASNPITSMTIALVTSATGAFAGEETVLQSKTVLVADLTANTRVMHEPVHWEGALQHIAMKFTPVGGAATTGAYDAFFTKDPERQEAIA